MAIFKNKYFAIICGTFASTSSLFGKAVSLVENNDYQGLFLKGVLICFMILCNMAMWTFYLKALNASCNTIVPTVTSAAANYILSALFGYYVFDESMSYLWWLGFLLIIFGLYLICANYQEDPHLNNKSE
ncbi:transmembrane protein 42-like [Ctenocephalides felis]|uniref:transmembrane protein 42-like n=1 Tax=Ctenocephalides felis TaxID=7515 RepID=UPI000E6E4315|nr:transmembrane protein 42-like [Ctenocephalides felis]